MLIIVLCLLCRGAADLNLSAKRARGAASTTSMGDRADNSATASSGLVVVEKALTAISSPVPNDVIESGQEEATN